MTDKYPMTPKQRLHYFTTLEKIRQSGKINMFGAHLVLAKHLGIHKRKAQQIVHEWMTLDRAEFKDIQEQAMGNIEEEDSEALSPVT